MTETLHQIKAELTAIVTNKNQECDRLRQQIESLSKDIKEKEAEKKEAESKTDYKILSEKVGELWSLEQTQKLLNDKLKKLESTQGITSEECKEYQDRIHAAAREESEKLIEKAKPLYDSLRELSAKSGEIYNQFDELTRLLTYDVMNTPSIPSLPLDSYRGRSIAGIKDVLDFVQFEELKK